MITVAVTGFAPFRQYKFNTSSIIRDALPDRISRPGKQPIKILKYLRDIPCRYADVLELVPELWSGRRSVYDVNCSPDEMVHIDVMLHIGMNAGDDKYDFEMRARREKYKEPGEDGVYLSPKALNGLPDELHPEFNINDVAARVAKTLPDSIQTRTSDNAGLYFCEFLFYVSLSELHQSRDFKRVEFLHVPGDTSEDAIERGKLVTCALIRELVESLP